MKTKTILLADTGIDDAVAIILALNSKHIFVDAIIATRGNVSCTQTTKNTLMLLNFLKNKTPVFVGDNKILSETSFETKSVHGKNGMGGFEFSQGDMKAQSWKKFEEYFLGLKEEVVFICTAPLTNLAVLLKKYPESSNKIQKIVIQSGLLSDDKYISFNVAVDPKAIEIVLGFNIPVVICPSDMGHIAYLNKNDVQKIKSFGKTGKMLEFIFQSYKDRVVQNDVATHDGCAVACVENPKIFKFQNAKVFVDYNENNLGILKFDFSENGQTKVCTQINVAKFKKLMFKAVKKAK